MKIKSLDARPILTSRATWTIEVALALENGGRIIASVPEGKSTGASEAHAVPAAQAVKNVNGPIARNVIGKDFSDQAEFDSFVNKVDGTVSKSKLGANAILAVSIAFMRATAAEKKIPLWQLVRSTIGDVVIKKGTATRPRLFMNLINGGLHGGSNLDIQEYVVIPKTKTFAEATQIGVEIRTALGEYLSREKGKIAINLGDEGGYAPDFKDNLEPVRILKTVVKKLGYENKVDFGMDAAATDIKNLNEKQLQSMYVKLIRDFGLIYLEDPFKEEEFERFAAFTAEFGKKLWIAGDDLTTTNVQRMAKAHAEKSVNAVIIKPNQIGSVTETLDAVRAARAYGWGVIVSHRSGETDDDFISDLAYGVCADGMKLGAPARGERVAKYNRLLEIEKSI